MYPSFSSSVAHGPPSIRVRLRLSVSRSCSEKHPLLKGNFAPTVKVVCTKYVIFRVFSIYHIHIMVILFITFPIITARLIYVCKYNVLIHYNQIFVEPNRFCYKVKDAAIHCKIYNFAI